MLSSDWEGPHLGAWPWHRICSDTTFAVFITATFAGGPIPSPPCSESWKVAPDPGKAWCRLHPRPGLHLLCHWGTTPARTSLMTTCQLPFTFSERSPITTPNSVRTGNKCFSSKKNQMAESGKKL